MSTADLLAERYGAPAPWRRRVLIAVVAVVVVAFAGWLSWTVYEQARPQASSQLVGFTIDGPGSVTARLQVDVRGGVQATCDLKAYAADHTLVGERDFAPAPGTSDSYSVSINTEREATSVDLVGCTAPGQPRPR